jgi:mannosylglucosylglycerate synthase
MSSWPKRIGMLHCNVGLSDGVSIVIQQIIHSLTTYGGFHKDNFSYVCGSSGFDTDDSHVLVPKVYQHSCLSHKDPVVVSALAHFSSFEFPSDLIERLEERIKDAMFFLASYLISESLDVLIAHNTAHPVNLVYSVALSRLYGVWKEDGSLQRVTEEGFGSASPLSPAPSSSSTFTMPKYVCWWHDSVHERDRFSHPNELFRNFIREGLCGPHVDGIVFINHMQWTEFAEPYFRSIIPHGIAELENRQLVIPNTTEVVGSWRIREDIGVDCPFVEEVELKRFVELLDITPPFRPFEDVLLLQHTRIVPRKRIDTAIDFAFALGVRRKLTHPASRIFVLVSGESGDELTNDIRDLETHFSHRMEEFGGRACPIKLLWGSVHGISSKKVVRDGEIVSFSFDDVPSFAANLGAIGTYFSDMEGFGNNLLEIMSAGIPTLVRRYRAFETEFEPLGFLLPHIGLKENEIQSSLVDIAQRYVHDVSYRNEVVHKNAEILKKHLGHDQLEKCLKDLFARLESHP